jgi:hypothetical protein
MVLLAVLLAFMVPLGGLFAAKQVSTASEFLVRMQAWGFTYSMLAAFIGLAVAMLAWRPDHLARHVYALSLPISRPQYAWFRFLAGATFLAPVLAAFLVGCLLVAVSGAIPEGLRAYPFSITFRFLMALLTAYALLFAIAASTPRTAGIVLLAITSVFLAQILLSAIISRPVDILTPIRDFIFYRPGILSVFSGRWMLVDA